jgi:guanosine-3',5'-bis(diphosphate) 3'-pyrophosphohydrolase
MFKIILAVFVTLATSCVADVQSTRDVLAGYSANNPKVLEVYDRVTASWVAYEAQHEGKWDLQKLLTAVEFAAKKHEGQTRKDAEKTPYIVHPIGVSELLWDVGAVRSVNVLTAALLHDTLEDTDATESEIEALFGSRVLHTVSEVTNDSSLSGEENKQRQIDHAPMMSLDAQLVKLADRLYNIRDLDSPPPSWTQEKVDGYFAWGEKLLSVLAGTNAGLESALQMRIDTHKEQKGSNVVRHKIKSVLFRWDPYEGNYIDEYIFTLDDGSVWNFDWSPYERNGLALRVGDEIQISSLGNHQYEMIIPEKEGSVEKRVNFIKYHLLDNHYYAM